MEAKPAKDQSTNSGRDKTHMGLHQMPAVRKSDQGSLDSFDKRYFFYR